MTEPSQPPVTWSEIKRDFRSSRGLIGLLFPAALLWSQHQLRATTLSSSARLAWFLIPFPFMALALWSHLRSNKKIKEMERQVTGAAASYTLVFSVLFYAILGQADVAFKLDPANWGYQETWFLPLLVFGFCWALVYKRLNPR